MRCPICDETLPTRPERRGRRRLYCSNRCRQVALRRRRTCGCQVDLQPAGLEDKLELAMPKVTDPHEELATTLGMLLFCQGTLLAVAPKIESRLAWRCRDMAAHIDAGLTQYFRA